MENSAWPHFSAAKRGKASCQADFHRPLDQAKDFMDMLHDILTKCLKNWRREKHSSHKLLGKTGPPWWLHAQEATDLALLIFSIHLFADEMLQMDSKLFSLHRDHWPCYSRHIAKAKHNWFLAGQSQIQKENGNNYSFQQRNLLKIFFLALF